MSSTNRGSLYGVRWTDRVRIRGGRGRSFSGMPADFSRRVLRCLPGPGCACITAGFILLQSLNPDFEIETGKQGNPVHQGAEGTERCKNMELSRNKWPTGGRLLDCEAAPLGASGSGGPEIKCEVTAGQANLKEEWDRGVFAT